MPETYSSDGGGGEVGKKKLTAKDGKRGLYREFTVNLYIFPNLYVINLFLSPAAYSPAAYFGFAPPILAPPKRRRLSGAA